MWFSSDAPPEAADPLRDKQNIISNTMLNRPVLLPVIHIGAQEDFFFDAGTSATIHSARWGEILRHFLRGVIRRKPTRVIGKRLFILFVCDVVKGDVCQTSHSEALLRIHKSDTREAINQSLSNRNLNLRAEHTRFKELMHADLKTRMMLCTKWAESTDDFP